MFDPTEVRDRFRGWCHGCKWCDGKVCAGKVPGMGGIGRGRCFQSNVEKLAMVAILPRFIHDIEEVNTGVDFLGLHLSFPVIAAPIAGMWRNLPDVISEEELIRAFVGGAKRTGTVSMTGGGLMPDGKPIEELIFEAIGDLGGGETLLPILKPHREDSLLAHYIAAAEQAGCKAVGVDVDSMLALTKWNGSRSRGVESWRKIVGATNIPLILKGIMTADDAKAAVDAGVSAIVVSNHGGRVMDDMASTVEVLPGIASAVGNAVTVLADGGVRTGADVFKMLALGARAVLVGRPLVIGAVMRGDDGVQNVISALRDGLVETMRLTGTASVAQITPELVRVPYSI